MHDMKTCERGMQSAMGLVNRIVDAIVVVITAPFRAITALFGRR